MRTIRQVTYPLVAEKNMSNNIIYDAVIKNIKITAKLIPNGRLSTFKCVIKYNGRQLTYDYFPSKVELKQNKVNPHYVLYKLLEEISYLQNAEDVYTYAQNQGLNIPPDKYDFFNEDYERTKRYLAGVLRLFTKEERAALLQNYIVVKNI